MYPCLLEFIYTPRVVLSRIEVRILGVGDVRYHFFSELDKLQVSN